VGGGRGTAMLAGWLWAAPSQWHLTSAILGVGRTTGAAGWCLLGSGRWHGIAVAARALGRQQAVTARAG
jgi:hypothetical protein